MNFVETGQACIIVERLSIQNRNGDFSDVDFVVQKQIVNAHRNVLAARSNYFSKVFKKNQVIKEVFMVENCQSVEAFRNFLNYMYTGCIYVDGTNVGTLMRMANQFAVDKLTGYCETYLKVNLVPSNAYMVCDLAQKHKLTELQKHVSDFMEKNSLQILEQDRNLLQLNMERMKKFLVRVTASEFEKFLFFCKWMNYDLKSRKGNLKPFLAIIDWKEMDMDAFKKKVEKTSFLHNKTKGYEILVSFLKSKDIEFSVPESEILGLEETLKNLSPVKIESRSDEHDEVVVTTVPMEYSPAKLEAKSTVASKSSCRRKRKQNLLSKAKKVKKHKGTDTSLDETTGENASVDSNSTVEHDHTFHSHSSTMDIDSNSNRHLLLKTSRKDLKCEQCTFATNTDRILKKHIERVHGDLDYHFKCNKCDFSCNFSIEFYTHLKTHYDGPPYNCEYCDFLGKSINRFYDHILIHTNLYPCQCKYCDEKFRSPDILRKHIHSKHSQKTIFVCQTCGREFARIGLLHSHQIVHEMKKLYLCEICGFSNKNLRYLQMHMRKHN